MNGVTLSFHISMQLAFVFSLLPSSVFLLSLLVSSHPLIISLCISCHDLTYMCMYPCLWNLYCAYDRRNCSGLSSSYYILLVPLSLHLDHILFMFSLYFYICMPMYIKFISRLCLWDGRGKHDICIQSLISSSKMIFSSIQLSYKWHYNIYILI